MKPIINKECSTCNCIKHISEFIKRKHKKDGLSNQCKQCINLKRKEYVANHKDELKAKLEIYLQINKEKIRSRQIEYYQNNKERLTTLAKKWRKENPDKIKKYQETWLARNPNLSAERWARLKEQCPEKLKQKRKEYYEKNKAKEHEYTRKYNLKRKKEDPVFDLICRMRSLINGAIKAKRFRKSAPSTEILGCDWHTFISHIESQFTCGMSWDNRSLWHVDHKTPLATAKTEDEIIKLNHYSNLQPLWAKDNLEKGSSLCHKLGVSLSLR